MIRRISKRRGRTRTAKEDENERRKGRRKKKGRRELSKDKIFARHRQIVLFFISFLFPLVLASPPSYAFLPLLVPDFSRFFPTAATADPFLAAVIPCLRSARPSAPSPQSTTPATCSVLVLLTQTHRNAGPVGPWRHCALFGLAHFSSGPLQVPARVH